MKIFATILTLVISTFAIGQSLKTVKVKSRYLLEQYEVRADTDTLRDGMYRKYFRDGNVLLEEGTYANNRRTGVWTFYNGKGQPELVYDYSAGKVLVNDRTPLDSMGLIEQEGKIIAVKLDQPPLYLASSQQLGGIFQREIRFPVHLQRAGMTELSWQIAATVSPAGTHYRNIVSHKDKEFEKNAQQASQLGLKNVEWLPAIHQGQFVTTIYMLPAVMLRGYSVQRTLTIKVP